MSCSSAHGVLALHFRLQGLLYTFVLACAVPACAAGGLCMRLQSEHVVSLLVDCIPDTLCDDAFWERAGQGSDVQQGYRL